MKSNKLEQKNFERDGVEAFLDIVGIDKSQLEEGNEPPDFILNHNGKRIYLEHTEMMSFSGEGARKRLKEVKKLIKELKDTFTQDQDETPVSVYLDLEYKIDFSGKKRKPFIKTILSTVKDCLPLKTDSIIINDDLPKGVNSVEVYCGKGVTETYWGFDDHVYFGDVKETELKKAVNGKEDAAKKDSKNNLFDEYWLFLHTGGDFSTFGDVRVPVEYFNKNWVFDQIILFDKNPSRKSPKQAVYRKDMFGKYRLD